jgi:hypothetical protein
LLAATWALGVDWWIQEFVYLDLEGRISNARCDDIGAMAVNIEDY